jgi:hypothetical protein
MDTLKFCNAELKVDAMILGVNLRTTRAINPAPLCQGVESRKSCKGSRPHLQGNHFGGVRGFHGSLYEFLEVGEVDIVRRKVL